MKRDEYTKIMVQLIINQAPRWLPEEAPVDMMHDTMMKRWSEHEDVIKDYLNMEDKDGNNLE